MVRLKISPKIDLQKFYDYPLSKINQREGSWGHMKMSEPWLHICVWTILLVPFVPPFMGMMRGVFGWEKLEPYREPRFVFEHIDDPRHGFDDVGFEYEIEYTDGTKETKLGM